MGRLIKNNWFKALVINIIIAAAIIICTHMVYETNDDYSISSRIVSGYAAVYFVNYYLCLFLAKVQELSSDINIFVIAQIATSFVSWTCITKLLLDKAKRFSAVPACVAAIAVLSFDSYCTIQFSKTAAIACIAGFLICIDSIANKRQWFYYILAVILVCLGVSFRSDVLIVALAFAALFAFKLLIENRSSIKDAGPLRIIASFAFVIILVFGAFFVKNASEKVFETRDDLREYQEYNHFRSEVVDTPLLNGYEKHLEDYEEIGLSENDIKLIRNWMFDYDGAASKENLEAIYKVGNHSGAKEVAISSVKRFIKGTISGAKDLSDVGIRIIILILLALWIMLTSDKYGRLYVIAIGGMTVLLHIYLYYIGRPANRTMFIPDICAIITMLYIAIDSKEKRISFDITASLVAIMMILLIVPTYHNAGQLYEKVERGVMPAEFEEYVRENQDKFFVVATREKGSSSGILRPWKAPDTQGESNILGYGSWGTMSPYLFDKMKKYGMHNPIKDLIDKDNAYFVGNKNIERMSDYYNKWHAKAGANIYLEQVGEVGGKKIWSVKTEAQ